MTLQTEFAVDFVDIAADWGHEISRQTVSIATSAAGVETETLSAATTFDGVWQPVEEKRAALYEQQPHGKTGRPKWFVAAPNDQAANIGDVLTFRGEPGEVRAIEQQEGHKELMLWERK